MIRSVFFLFFLLPCFANAQQTIPAESYRSPIVYKYIAYGWTGSSAYYSSPDLACQDIAQQTTSRQLASSSESQCVFSDGVTRTVDKARFCDGVAISSYETQCPLRLRCPDNTWQLNGQFCTKIPDCQPGFEKVGNDCLPICPVNYDRNESGQCVRDCTAKQGQPTENGSYQFTGAVSGWSVSGCRVRCPVRTLAAGGGRGDECVYTGVSADPNDPPAEPDDRPDLDPPPEEPDDCLRRGQGYISGSNGISCVAPSDAPPGNRPVTENDKTDESGSPGPDGKPDPNSPDYKRNDSTAKNNGDGTITENGTETRKGTPDGDGYTCPDGYTKIGNGMCQKQWSKTQDENTFCQQNPKSPLCTGKLNDCEEGTDLARCLRLGKVPDGQEVQEKTIGVSYINPVAVATGGGCPAGIALPKGLGNFNWEPICTFATAIQPIVLVLAWMSAFFIVFGIKDD